MYITDFESDVFSVYNTRILFSKGMDGFIEKANERNIGSITEPYRNIINPVLKMNSAIKELFSDEIQAQKYKVEKLSKIRMKLNGISLENYPELVDELCRLFEKYKI